MISEKKSRIKREEVNKTILVLKKATEVKIRLSDKINELLKPKQDEIANGITIQNS